MPSFTIVYYETRRLSHTIEANSVEEAICDASALKDYDACAVEILGTNGVEEVLDAEGNVVYDSDEETT